MPASVPVAGVAATSGHRTIGAGVQASRHGRPCPHSLAGTAGASDSMCSRSESFSEVSVFRTWLAEACDAKCDQHDAWVRPPAAALVMSNDRDEVAEAIQHREEGQ